MKKRNKFKSNLNYYTKWDGYRTLGLCAMVVGFVCVWIPYSYFMYIIGGLGLVGGIGLFLFGSVESSTEAEIKEEIERRCGGIEFRELEKEHHFYHRVPKNVEEFEFKGFDFGKENLLKRMKNGSYGSSAYIYAKMVLLTDAFYIKTRRFSLLKEGQTDETFEILASDIQNIEVRREKELRELEKGKKAELKLCHIVICYGEGKELLLPRNDDIYADEFVAKLKKQFGI